MKTFGCISCIKNSENKYDEKLTLERINSLDKLRIG